MNSFDLKMPSKLISNEDKLKEINRLESEIENQNLDDKLLKLKTLVKMAQQ